MDADEREIFLFLKSWGAEFIGGIEIARRASTKKRFHKDPDWAKPVLIRMVERGIVESDLQGHYRLKPVAKKTKNKRWISPDIAKLLKESGVEVEQTSDIASDEYYEQL